MVLMISVGIEVHEFVQTRLILEGKLGDDPLGSKASPRKVRTMV